MNAPFRLNTDTIWTPALIERLTKLWADGFSASQCAGMLGGMSRSAVIGKLHRLHVPARIVVVKPKKPKPRPPRRFNTEKAAEQFARQQARLLPKEPMAIPTAPESRPCTLLELTADTCHFPIGDPGQPDFHFCGAKPEYEGRSYCEFHHTVTHYARLL